MYVVFFYKKYKIKKSLEEPERTTELREQGNPNSKKRVCWEFTYNIGLSRPIKKVKGEQSSHSSSGRIMTTSLFSYPVVIFPQPHITWPVSKSRVQSPPPLVTINP